MRVNTQRRSAQIHSLGAIKSSGGTERLTEERNSVHVCVYGGREEKRCGGPLNRAATERERKREREREKERESGQAVRKKNKERKKELLADC